MAKHRRPGLPRTTKESGASRAAGGTRSPDSRRPATSPPSKLPRHRPAYIEAVGLYEQGVDALQRRDFPTAAHLFETILVRYPEEKELHERVRLYLNICSRQKRPHDTAPRTLEERLYAATLAINSGRYDEAILHLRLVRDEEPNNDHALYMLAVAHAQRGEPVEAIAHLERALTLNPENRILAKDDPDLDPLRNDETFRAAVETHLASRFDRRRPLRPRSSR